MEIHGGNSPNFHPVKKRPEMEFQVDVEKCDLPVATGEFGPQWRFEQINP